MTERNTPYDDAEHEAFGFVDDEQPNEEGLEEAILDADDYFEADDHGMTPREEREGTPLEQQLAAEVPEEAGPPSEAEPEDPSAIESDPLQPIPDGPGDPNHPDPVPPEPVEPVDPHTPDPTRPEPGEPPETDPVRPIPDESPPPRH